MTELAQKVDAMEQKISDYDRRLEGLLAISQKMVCSLEDRIAKYDKDASHTGSTLDHIANEIDFIRDRLSTYLGDHIALTYLSDRTPIFVDTRNPATAAIVMNGGVYEQGNVETILSFVKPNTVFLDIGANIGLFSLKVAARLDDRGKIYAFEPQKDLVKLIRRSAFMNRAGFLDRPGKITCYEVGLSDRNGETGFLIPPTGHLGGARVVELRKRR